MIADRTGAIFRLFSRTTVNLEDSAVQLDQFLKRLANMRPAREATRLDEVQADPSAFVRPADALNTMKAFSDEVLIARRDTHTAIVHGEDCLTWTVLQDDVNKALHGVLERIADKVEDDFLLSSSGS